MSNYLSISAQIDKLQSTFDQWECTSDAAERVQLTKEVLAGCESIEWQVDSLHAICRISDRMAFL